MGYEITLRDRTRLMVDEADAFAHERTMTTFYRTANARHSVDCWAMPLASVRTDEILVIAARDVCVAEPSPEVATASN